ncbi:MAG: HAMP domain-containing histidine kinase [Nitratireductor sp.]|nr:HAMP domain-containing histidine kinase [Nitratireductor sp.]
MKTGSLRVRLFAAGAVSVIAALMLSALGLTLLFQNHVERRIEAELEVQLEQVLAGLGSDADGRLSVAKAPADPRFGRPLSGLYWQVATGRALLRSRSLWDQKLALPDDELADGSVHRHHIAGPNGVDLIAVERSVTLPERLGAGTVRVVVAQNANDVAVASRAFAVDLVPYLALLGVFLVGAAYAQITVGLRPLVALRERLTDVRTGKENRLGQGFPDEIRPLAVELDALLEAREEQIARARARAADLAHGLKTPLQVLAGDIERLKSKGETAIAEEIEHVAGTMRRHVDRQLARARMAADNPDAATRVHETISRVVAVVSRTPDGARRQWKTGADGDLVARIDPDDLAEALGNLIENAARHASGVVEISARSNDTDITVIVKDDGAGIPSAEIETALSRGGRLDGMPSGTGLGLAIASEIAEAWGGRLELDTAHGGLAAIFTVPAHAYGRSM